MSDQAPNPRHLLIVRHKGGACAVHAVEAADHAGAVALASKTLESGIRRNVDAATAEAAEVVTVAEGTALAVGAFLASLREERQRAAVEASIQDPAGKAALFERLKAEMEQAQMAEVPLPEAQA